MAFPQCRGAMSEKAMVRLDDDESPVASVLVEASTSGRVESAFWDERRQRRRRRRSWASPTGVLYVVNVRAIPFFLSYFFGYLNLAFASPAAVHGMDLEVYTATVAVMQ